MESPPAPWDHYTKKSLIRVHNAEHVVIVGYYKDFLKNLLSEMKKNSVDYLKNTMCLS